MRVLMLMLLASTAFASLVGFTPSPLTELMRRSQWVFVAERVGEAVVPAPRWKVIETLRFTPDERAGKVAAIAPTGVVTVLGAGQELNAMMSEHIAKHGYQGLPSPIVERYESAIDQARFEKSKRLILFVRRWKSDWQLAMEGGYEVLAKKSLVVDALKAPTPPRP